MNLTKEGTGFDIYISKEKKIETHSDPVYIVSNCLIFFQPFVIEGGKKKHCKSKDKDLNAEEVKIERELGTSVQH